LRKSWYDTATRPEASTSTIAVNASTPRGVRSTTTGASHVSPPFRDRASRMSSWSGSLKRRSIQTT
jgi:hypothetical protein